MAAYLYECMSHNIGEPVRAYISTADVEPDSLPGHTTFVAGFTQANVGDTSPNTSVGHCNMKLARGEH